MTTVTMRGYPSPDYGPLQEILRTFTYKPGWSFSIESHTRLGVLVIRAEVVDTDNLQKLIPLQFGICLPSFVQPEFPWTQWLFDQIMIVERHEAQEFFKIDGVKVFDPHG